MSSISNWACLRSFRERSIEQNPKESFANNIQSAISKNDPQIIEAAIASLSPEFIYTKLPNGELPLHFAIREQSAQVVELFFAHFQIDLNERDDQGLTALDHLFLTNNQEFKALVIGLFCKKTVEDIKGCSNEQIDIAKKEIRERVYEYSDLGPWHLAARNGNVDELEKILLLGFDINEQTLTGQTALYLAVKAGNESVVRWLIEHGAKTALLTNHKASVLHAAALGRNKEIINLLIDGGLSPDAYDDMGYTPLHWAISREDFTTARFLIEKRANPLIESAKVSPMALMVNIAQDRSQKRDPLKLGLLSTLMCACSIATWIQSYYGNNNDLLASVLQYTTPFVLSGMAVSHGVRYLINFFKNQEELNRSSFFSNCISVLLALAPLDGVPILGEASLICRTYWVGQSIWQGIQAGWRNRKLDPSRAFKNVVVHSTNAAFSVWNIYGRKKSIWNAYNLQKEVKSQLANRDCSGALKTASEIHWYSFRDTALVDIANQCTENDLDVAEQAVSLMYDFSSQDLGRRAIVNRQLSQGNCEGALGAASKMNIATYQDTALSSIVTDSGCLEKQPDVTLKAASLMNIATYQDTALQTLATNHLKQGNCEGSLDAASKMNIATYQDAALSSIVTDSGCLEKQPDVTLKAASLMNIATYQDTALQTLATNHLKQGNCEGSLDAASKMNIATYQDAALSSIVTDSGCLEKQPDVTLKAASLMNIATYQDTALQTLATNHLKQGNCEGALDAASRMNIASYQHVSLNSIATDPICLEKHKVVADKAAYLLESDAWWSRITTIACATLLLPLAISCNFLRKFSGLIFLEKSSRVSET